MANVPYGRIARTAPAAILWLLASAAHAFTIGGGGDARKVDLAATYDVAADPASTAPTYIVARGQPKNVTKVAIASFCLSIVDGRSVAGSSGPFTASSSSPFPGTLDPQRLKALASEYRSQFEDALRASGVEVLTPEALAALPTYQKLSAKMTADTFQADDSYELGKGTWANNQVQVLPAGAGPVLKDCRKLTPGTTTSLVKAVYQADMEGIALLNANVTMDFADAKAAGGFFRGAKADLVYGQYVVPGIDNTAFTFVSRTGGGTLWLKQAIVAAQNPFAEGAKGEKSTDVKLDNEYDPNSGSTSTTSQSTALSADMELWHANAGGLLKALSGMVAQALKTGR